jgi:nucleotide-binding universal stress UspA family protein
MKVLISTDGSESARISQLSLDRAGLPQDVEAVVLSVADVWLPPRGAYETNLPKEWIEASMKSRKIAESAVSTAKELAMADTENLKRLHPSWKITAEATADSPGWAIVTHAEQWGADLVVVGSHDHRGLEKLWLGSVSQKVIRHCNNVVRIGRASLEPDRKEIRLIIGVDGSAGSLATVEHVISRNWPSETKVQLITVIDTRIATAAVSDLPELGRWTETNSPDARGWIEDVLSTQSAKFRCVGLKVFSTIQEGDPKRILIEHADEWKADCIFVGARGLTGIERFLLGSVSSAVSARARCSVEVIHHS